MKAQNQWDAISWTIPAMIVLVLVGCGAAAGWWWAQPDGKPETPAPAQRQADNSLILERRPDPRARPRQKIPPSARLERVAQVTVQPDTTPSIPGAPCPPVTVDLSLVQDQAGAPRVLASSPDGQVVGGIDIPVAPAQVPDPPRRWAAGLSWSPITRTSGIWVERDVRIPIIGIQARVGVEVRQAAGVQASALDGMVRIGFAF